MNRFPRRAGVLLHPSSLPGRHGIGDLGSGADSWLDFLTEAGATLWQILPLQPTGYGNSPYAARSAFAGNTLLVSIDRLVDDGLLDAHDADSLPTLSDGPVDYALATEARQRAFRIALDRLSGDLASEFAAFSRREASWLDDFALYMAVSEVYGFASWTKWEPGIRKRDPGAMARWSQHLAGQMRLVRFGQWLFARQWGDLRRKANERGIQIVGDLPIFVAHNSADVWARPDLFSLDADGEPTVVAGVPPDYFSATGQRWGNPLYRWDVMAKDGYAWWIDRLVALLRQVDILRIDHFRGFADYWEIPGDRDDAVEGSWRPGPGKAFFDAVKAAIGDVPIVVEDLGMLSPEVLTLRDSLGFPGMLVLHFAWEGGPTNPYLPMNYAQNAVVYTGTHDNDTTVGWYHASSEDTRDHVRRYLAVPGTDISWDLIRAALASVADTAIIPFQDLLNLGSWARMNTPGVPSGNWAYRMAWHDLRPDAAARFRDLVDLYGRAAEVPNAE